MIAKEQLKSIVERIERLEGEKADLSGDIKEVFAEAKASGFDVKTLRAVIKLRKVGMVQWEESERLIEIYCDALGMTPLEEAIESTKRVKEMA